MGIQLSRKKRQKRIKDRTGIELSRRIFLKFFTTLTIFTVGLVVTFILLSAFFSSFTWYRGDFLYELLKPINDNQGFFLITSWIIGFIAIFIYYWRKTLGYVRVIAQASNKLISSENELISLPDEMKQIENQMNQVKQAALRNELLAKEAEKRKNDLIIYLAHDLKTPLTSVIGYLTLLRDEQQISEELREKYISISLEKSERLEELINEFFEITRFNLSSMTLELSRVDLTRMLEQIVYEFNPLFNDKNLKCRLDIDSEIEIKCDVNKMERVFDNLIRNAINYSFEDSEIVIKVLKNEKGVFIRFINHGNTIPKEKLGRIFEQFYRLDSARSSKTGGAGLGLAIAKQILELHFGSISAKSENEMVEFSIFLPIMP